MATVKSDILTTNTASLGFNGWEFKRGFDVSGLVGPGYAMGIEAYNDPGVPKMDDAHPSIPDAYVVDVSPEPIGSVGDAQRLIYTYRQFTENYQVSVGYRMANFETTGYIDNVDAGVISGNVSAMTLEYDYPADHSEKANEPGDKQGVTLGVQRPLPTITISRTEWLTNAADVANGYALGIQLTGQILTNRGLIYNGALNKAGWNLRPSAYAGRWRCLMEATSAENGFDWRVTYRFESDNRDWKYRATYKDITTNEAVPDPTNVAPTATGSQKDFDQYLHEDFSKLGLY